MRAAETFSGVQVLTWAALDNHFHICLHVPERQDVSDDELRRRLGALYERQEVLGIVLHLAYLRKVGQHQAAERLRARYTDRMYELSEFMKTLKQRLTQSFNRRHSRKGTLWEERFKSIVVQGRQGALATVAAYVDLNAVRAGIVSDPGRYRFCGYGEAVGGSRKARRGLGALMCSLGPEARWDALHAEYRKLLYVSGESQGVAEAGEAVKPGFSAEAVQSVLDADGQLTVQQALHCRVRYFTDGFILGSQSYVDGAFERYRSRFSPKRSTGARCMKGADWGALCTARQLRLAVITVPAG